MTSWRDLAADSLVLFLVIAIPASFYVPTLGFYSDDWSFLATMTQSPDQSFAGLYAYLAKVPNLAPRPVQIVVLVLQYLLLGLHPFWGHVTNHVVLWLGAVALYAALRELTASRLLALAIIGTYLCLPHFSTTRMWFANFQAHWAFVFFGFCLLSMMRMTAAKTLFSTVLWQMAAIVFMVLSVLAYELFLPLMVIFPVWVLVLRMRRPAASWFERLDPRMMFCAGAAIVTAIVLVGFKLAAASDSIPSVAHDWLLRALRLYAVAAWGSFWQLGLLLPVDVLKLVSSTPQPGPIAAGLLVSLLMFLSLSNANRAGSGPRMGFHSIADFWFSMIAALAVFAAGYAVLLQNFYASLRIPTGIGNRVNIAGALGVAAVIITTVAGLDLLRRGKGRSVLLALVAACCGCGAYLMATIGMFWDDAFALQETIYARLTQTLPDLTDGSTVLLYGVCPYHGPAPVFTSSWDLSSRLQLTTHRTILADIVTSDSSFGPSGVTQVEYGSATTSGYGQLFVYDNSAATFTQLQSYPEALEFFSRHPIDNSSPCSFADGGGEALF